MLEPGHLEEKSYKKLVPAEGMVLVAVRKENDSVKEGKLILNHAEAYDREKPYFLSVMAINKEDSVWFSVGDFVIAHNFLSLPTFIYRGYKCMLIPIGDVKAKACDITS